MKINVQNVSKSFKNEAVLNNINISFNDGKIYGLIGRNGSGKSVFLKILCGFYVPDCGFVKYNDIDIFKDNVYPPSTRALIEKPTFLSDLSGYENLKILASLNNIIGEKEINDALDKVDLLDEKDKKYHKYSLGMKQKLGIAQAIMENPDVLILDEPFNGLDEKSTKKIRKVLLEEKKKGKIIILASHIRDDIELLADEVYKMDAGSLKKVNKNDN